MSRVVITEFMDAPAVDRLRAAHDVLYDPALVDDAPRMLAEAAGADAFIVRNRTQVRGDLLAALTRCRVVGRLGVGLDNIDVEACRARGLPVLPATGANADSVAEYVVGTAMLLLRGAYLSTAAVADGPSTLHGIHHLRQHLDAGKCGVQLSGSMVGDDNPAHAMLGAQPGVFRRHDALDHER